MPNTAFFMLRLNDHVQYLKKIDAALNDKNDFKGTDHHDCKLGQWLYGEGRAEIQALNNPKAETLFNSLLEPHEQFHTISHQALEYKAAGDMEAMKAAMTEMHKLSQIISQNLLELDTLS